MTDLSSHSLSRGPAGDAWRASGAIDGLTRRLARLSGRLVRMVKRRRARISLAGLSSRQRQDIGLSGHDRLDREPGLGAVNQARGYDRAALLGSPFGR